MLSNLHAYPKTPSTEGEQLSAGAQDIFRSTNRITKSLLILRRTSDLSCLERATRLPIIDWDGKSETDFMPRCSMAAART